MVVRVRLFASFRESAGVSASDLPLADGATVTAAIAALQRQFPRLRLAAHAMLAVNHEYVGPDFQLHDGDELALIPPVSGG